MRVNSVVGLNKYDIHKELSNKYTDKRKTQDKEQDISFADILEQVKRNIQKSGYVRQK